MLGWYYHTYFIWLTSKSYTDFLFEQFNLCVHTKLLHFKDHLLAIINLSVHKMRFVPSVGLIPRAASHWRQKSSKDFLLAIFSLCIHTMLICPFRCSYSTGCIALTSKSSKYFYWPSLIFVCMQSYYVPSVGFIPGVASHWRHNHHKSIYSNKLTSICTEW